MNTQTHAELANFIWSICNLLRGPYKRNEYRKVILPLTVLRRFDCVLAATKGGCSRGRCRARRIKRVRAPRVAGDSLGTALLQHLEAGLPAAAGRPEPHRAEPCSLHPRLLVQRARDHGALRLRRADRAYGRKEPVVPGRPEFRRPRPLTRARRQRTDGLCLRGADPHRRRAGQRGGRRALHAARGYPADGKPAAFARARPRRAIQGEDHLRPGLRHRGHALGHRGVPAAAQPRRESEALRAGLERRSLGGLHVRHAHQGRERRQHRPGRLVHPGRVRTPLRRPAG